MDTNKPSWFPDGSHLNVQPILKVSTVTGITAYVSCYDSLVICVNCLQEEIPPTQWHRCKIFLETSCRSVRECTKCRLLYCVLTIIL